jgi:hypothetical protein
MRESWFWDACGSSNGDDVRDGSGVFASFSKESVLFLFLRRVEGGDGGGLGGRCRFWYCSCDVTVAMVCCVELRCSGILVVKSTLA